MTVTPPWTKIKVAGVVPRGTAAALEARRSEVAMLGSAMMVLSAVICGLIAPLFVTGWRPEIFRVETGDALRPKIQLWLILIIAQAALWVLCCFYLGSSPTLNSSVISQTQTVKATGWIFLPLGALLLGLVVQQVLWPPPLPPRRLGDYDISRLHFLGAIGMLVAGWAVWKMYAVRAVMEAEFASIDSSGAKIERYLDLREQTLWLLFIAGVVLALGTIAAAALRNAVNASPDSNYFPAEYIIIYGALYSILLLVAYAPVYATLFATGVELRNSLCTHSPTLIVDFKQWSESREAINQSFGLTFSGAAALGPSLSTLLPILSAWLANLLGKA